MDNRQWKHERQGGSIVVYKQRSDNVQASISGRALVLHPHAAHSRGELDDVMYGTFNNSFELRIKSI